MEVYDFQDIFCTMLNWKTLFLIIITMAFQT